MFNDEVASLREELAKIYKDLHQHPEIGFTETRTAGIVADYLRACGLEVTEHVAMTGVVGVLDSGKPGKTLMLRADMDCLAVDELTDCPYKSLNPGKMHACGHDAHVTMLLGAAKILSRHKDSFDGKIKFVFQPAEEETPKAVSDAVCKAGYQGQGGAGFMIQAGVLKDVDACVIMHVQPTLKAGTVSVSKKNAAASSDVFFITLQGKGGHGAQPHKAIDPVPALAELITAIHMLPTREVSATETCVISIGKVETPGSVWNAVAEKACLSGGYRTFNQEVRQLLGKRIEELANTIACAYRCTPLLGKLTGYMPCINDEHIAKLIAASAREVLGDKQVIFTEIPAMSSDDCGAYLSKVPGAYFWLGIGEDDPPAPLHSPKFRLNPAILATGTLVHVNNAIKILEDLNQ